MLEGCLTKEVSASFKSRHMCTSVDWWNLFDGVYLFSGINVPNEKAKKKYPIHALYNNPVECSAQRCIFFRRLQNNKQTALEPIS